MDVCPRMVGRQPIGNDVESSALREQNKRTQYVTHILQQYITYK